MKGNVSKEKGKINKIADSIGESSLVFNDTEDNETNIPFGFISGKNNKAVVRGRKITNIDASTRTITVDNISYLSNNDTVLFCTYLTAEIAAQLGLAAGYITTPTKITTVNPTNKTFKYTASNILTVAISNNLIRAASQGETSTDVGKGYWIIPTKNTTAGTLLTFEQPNDFCVFMSGSGNVATAFSTTFGLGNEALGLMSMVGGRNSKALSEFSMAFGDGLISEDANCLVIGTYNKTPIMIGNGKQYRFIIGNGSGDSENERYNAFTVDTEGNGMFGSDVFVRDNKTEQVYSMLKVIEVLKRNGINVPNIMEEVYD